MSQEDNYQDDSIIIDTVANTVPQEEASAECEILRLDEADGTLAPSEMEESADEAGIPAVEEAGVQDKADSQNEAVTEAPDEVQGEAESQEPVASEKGAGTEHSGKSKESPMVPAEQSLSNKLYLIPVSGRPIFPGIFTPLMITANDDARVAEEAYSGDGLIGIVMYRQRGILQDTSFIRKASRRRTY